MSSEQQPGTTDSNMLPTQTRVGEGSSNMAGTSALRAQETGTCSSDVENDELDVMDSDDENDELDMIDSDDENDANDTWTFSQEAARKAVANMVLVDELSFKFVESEGFKEFITAACPQFKIPSRWTVIRDCYQLYLDEKLKLKSFLKSHSQRISLTTDTWTSNRGLNYMCVTAHFIDDEWKLNKRILSFVPISEHGGKYIAKSLEDCLLDWGLTNVFTMTADASSNDIALTNFRERMLSWGTVVCNGSYLHMRCIAYVLNLVVNDGLKDYSATIEKVRECVRFFESSPERLDLFREVADSVGIETNKCLCLDVPTRWNSTYLMLETACSYKRAFEKHGEDDSSFRADLNGNVPDFHDWVTIQKLLDCLSHFYKLALRTFSSSYVTSNLHIQKICDLTIVLSEMICSHDVEVSQLGKNMKAKFDKYWGDLSEMNKLIFLAIVFDPSFKYEGMEILLTTMFGKDTCSLLFASIKNDLKHIFEEYVKLYELPGASGTSGSSDASGTSASQPTMNQFKVSQVANLLKKPMSSKERLMQQRLDMEDDVRKKNELEIYLSESTLKDNSLDLLKWWKTNSERFPVLSKIARDILAVPISTVASESAFNTGGRILDDFRSSLTHGLVEAVICAQDWLRATDTPAEVEETLEDLDDF